MHNYDLLISRLDAFIRKYYVNRLLRGVLVFATCLLFFLLTVTVSEYFLYMPVWLRTGIAVLFVVGGVWALVAWIFMPVMHIARLGKIITHEQAAVIIGHHFAEVSDKLLNILQLRKATESSGSRELIEASIEQKASQLAVVPVVSAIDLSRNRKYLPYFLPVLLAGVFMLVAAPNIFRDASQRLLHPQQVFEKPAPFSFNVDTNNLKTTRNADFVLVAEASGEVIPADMAIEIEEDLIPMLPVSPGKFRYTFRNVTQSISFRLYSAGFYSRQYKLKVIQKPVLQSFRLHLDYPAYINKQDEQISSLGDITVPAGTRVDWFFSAEHADVVAMRFGNGPLEPMNFESDQFRGQFRFMQDTSYSLVLLNSKTGAGDTFSYYVKVLTDQYPTIQIQEHRDSVTGTQILLDGSAGDDYAISKVLFHYNLYDDQNRELDKQVYPLNIKQGALTFFQYYFDVQQLKVQPGQKLTYYLEAWDNDGVNGAKATRSQMMEYRMFDMDEIDSAMHSNAQQISSGLSNSSQRSEKIEEEYREMQSRLLKNSEMDWEQQEALRNMMKAQQGLETQMKAVKKRFEEQVKQSEHKEYSEDLREKQEAIKKQLDNLVNKELQEQMKKLQELMAKLNKEQALQTAQQLEQQNKLFKMDMERMQELMKKMEMQMRMEDMANKMEELAKKELALKEQTDQKTAGSEKLTKEQRDIHNELEDAMKKEMKEMEDLNNEMKEGQNLEDEKELANDASGQMEHSQQQLQKGENSKAGQSQNKAAQNLQQMAQSLRKAASGMDMDKLTKDIRAVRQILSNLVRLSFDQERLITEIKDVNPASQAYIARQQEQNRLHENSKMIRDSLFEMSKDMFKLAENVNRETTELEKNMRASVQAIENRRIGDAATRQQYVMTHTNNLALMLNEVLANLLSMQAQGKPGSEGQCNNPGGKTPKPGPGTQLSDVITQQKQLGDAMQQMQNAMQRRKGADAGTEGESNRKKPGGNQQQGDEYGDAEQLARLAQQQAAIRQKLQELNSLLNSKGMANIAKELREIQDEMDKNETQLVNRSLSNEQLLRHKEILSRLLEAEKSVREQQQDDKRSSKTAQEMTHPMPPELERYLKDKRELTEQYKATPPVLKPFHQRVIADYQRMLGI